MVDTLSQDIQTNANIKLSSIAKYILPALAGGGLLTGAAAIPAALNAYANDEDILKNIAGAAQYTMPIGMALGAGTVPINKIESLLASLIGKIPTKNDLISGGGDLVDMLSKKYPGSSAESIFNTSRSASNELTRLIKGMGGEIAQSGRDIVGLF